jgi:hypothetical protein
MTIQIRPQAINNLAVRDFNMLIDGKWTAMRRGLHHRARSTQPWRFGQPLSIRYQGGCRACDRRSAQGL